MFQGVEKGCIKNEWVNTLADKKTSEPLQIAIAGQHKSKYAEM